MDDQMYISNMFAALESGNMEMQGYQAKGITATQD